LNERCLALPAGQALRPTPPTQPMFGEHFGKNFPKGNGRISSVFCKNRL
jgi:hypothetical protein